MDRFELLYGLLDLESSRISSSTQNCIHIHINYASGYTVATLQSVSLKSTTYGSMYGSG